MSMKTSTLKAWVARDEDGSPFLYLDKPKKYKSEWFSDSGFYLARLPRELFSEVRWEDEEPTEIKLSIKDNVEKSKIKSALSFFGRFSLFVFFLSCTVVGLLHVIQWIIRQTFLT